ncbi:MAG: hypothetical protein ABSE81_04065 [Candidatus Omnitrophota bacterium]|jgi:hypothetical protein
MRNWIKVFKNLIIPTSLVFLMILPVLAVPLSKALKTPAPAQLVYPTSDIIDLRGKNYLEFKWIISSPLFIDYSDFRIYKTYTTYGKNLILKERIPSDTTSLRIKADTFQNNQVYTWVLKVVSRGGQKSDSVYNSFKVIK